MQNEVVDMQNDKQNGRNTPLEAHEVKSTGRLAPVQSINKSPGRRLGDETPDTVVHFSGLEDQPDVVKVEDFEFTLVGDLIDLSALRDE